MFNDIKSKIFFINEFKDSSRTLGCTNNITLIQSNRLILFAYIMAFVSCVSVDLQYRWEYVNIFNNKACDLYHNHRLWRDETVINN